MSVDFAFSAHNQYAITCIMLVARANAPVTVAEAAKRLGLSRPYVTDFFGAFEKSGLLSKGPRMRDGYSLARSSSTITLGEILAAERGTWYRSKFKRRGTFAPDFHEALLWQAFVRDRLESLTLEAILTAPEAGKRSRAVAAH